VTRHAVALSGAATGSWTTGIHRTLPINAAVKRGTMLPTRFLIVPRISRAVTLERIAATV